MSCLVSAYCYLNNIVGFSSCFSVYLFIWNHQSWWTPKCIFECLCVILCCQKNCNLHYFFSSFLKGPLVFGHFENPIRFRVESIHRLHQLQWLGHVVGCFTKHHKLAEARWVPILDHPFRETVALQMRWISVLVQFWQFWSQPKQSGGFEECSCGRKLEVWKAIWLQI